MHEFSYEIDNVFNIFSSYPLDDILAKYNINDYHYLNQIHSGKVITLDDNYKNNTDGDSLITNVPNKALIIRTADCIPIVLYDKKNKVLAAVHSGWKGTLNNIVINALNMMVDKYKSNIEDISAYLYPSIRQCHFEVEDDVYNLFKDKITNINDYTTNKGIKYYIDLEKIITDNLTNAGIKNIHDSNICTYCNHDEYYSYRYNKTAKRNYLVVYIKEGL
ncbi:MAG: peptidoglycan editing factor PgeF [Bacilli bacterium]|nr:peptidoglycan editing factor PgeF [Bacilli bacterium]